MTRIISIVGGLQPSTPTIGTATDGGTGTSANVAFTASSYIGKGTITYTATSSPGGFTGTGSSSPISVTGLTTGTAYTFTVVGTTNYGVSSLTSGASNSVTPVSPISDSYFPLGVVTVGSATASTITFSSIPSTYTHLQLRAIAMNTSGAAFIKWKFNSDSTGGNYYYHRFTGSGTGSPASYASTVDGSGLPLTTAYPSYFGGIVVDILDYSNTNKYKVFRCFSGWDGNGSGEINYTSGLWQSTSAITNIELTLSSFAAGTSFALYGIKGA
jgi:hypothetical protein